jgi:hypothetical protein
MQQNNEMSYTNQGQFTVSLDAKCQDVKTVIRVMEKEGL